MLAKRKRKKQNPKIIKILFLLDYNIKTFVVRVINIKFGDIKTQRN